MNMSKKVTGNMKRCEDPCLLYGIVDYTTKELIKIGKSAAKYDKNGVPYRAAAHLRRWRRKNFKNGKYVGHDLRWVQYFGVFDGPNSTGRATDIETDMLDKWFDRNGSYPAENKNNR